MNTGNEKQDERSRTRLQAKGVNPALYNLFGAVALEPDCPKFIVTEVLRTHKRQIELLAAGASRTLNSKHLIGRAVDVAMVVGTEVRWDWPLYHTFAQIVKRVAKQAGIPIIWGGDWKKFKDGPHFELMD